MNAEPQYDAPDATVAPQQRAQSGPPRILMCPPDHYGIFYEINPWMNRQIKADPVKARNQWDRLVETLNDLGVQVDVLEPHPGLPDLVFTANAGLVYGDRFLSAHFRHEVRQGETPIFDQWFQEHGYRVERLPEDRYFEGAGDALFCGETLFAGYRIRSDAGGMQMLGQQLNVHVLPLELVDDRYYHLDTCFCPLSPTEALFYPGAFDEYGRSVLKAYVPTLIEATAEEAARFSCNAVVVGRTVILNQTASDLIAKLERHGYQTRPLDLTEFIKSGGSAKCLTLRLDGEEAAGWRTRLPCPLNPTSTS